MTAISNRTPPVVIEYDCWGRRKPRRFEEAYKARQFYAAKDRQGKRPKVLTI